jgi:branched-chain amino acid transport system ATP-binding protein
MNNDSALQVTDLNAFYDQSHVLHGINFEITKGEVVTFLGRNGAGKTTTLRALMGLVKGTGSVRHAGTEILSIRTHRIARRGIGYIPEERGIFASLSVAENYKLPPRLADGGMSDTEISELFPNLAERWKSPGTALSGGEQQMLAIARVVRTGARLLLMDEITEGLAPVIVEQIRKAVVLLKSRGFTILLVEQNIEFARSVADRHYIIEHGEVIDQLDHTMANSDAGLRKIHTYLGI